MRVGNRKATNQPSYRKPPRIPNRAQHRPPENRVRHGLRSPGRLNHTKTRRRHKANARVAEQPLVERVPTPWLELPGADQRSTGGSRSVSHADAADGPPTMPLLRVFESSCYRVTPVRSPPKNQPRAGKLEEKLLWTAIFRRVNVPPSHPDHGLHPRSDPISQTLQASSQVPPEPGIPRISVSVAPKIARCVTIPLVSLRQDKGCPS